MRIFIFNLPGTKMYNYVGARTLREAERKLGSDVLHYVFLEDIAPGELAIKVNRPMIVPNNRPRWAKKTTR